MAYDLEQEEVSTTGVLLGSRIEILPSMPLPELNSAGGNAYAARMRLESESDLYAIICLSGLPPRLGAVTSMRSIDNPSIVRFIEAGVVAWTGGVKAYALVFQRPRTPRLMTLIDELRSPISEDAINNYFIKPMIGALIALAGGDVVHNSINPRNIYWRLGNAAPPELGECLSAPAGLDQHIIFEPIERALAMPLGRGVGTSADDCYSFGMTLAFIVLGRNPFQGLDEASIIDLKLSRGSFAAVTGSQRLSALHLEMLRGLLADDPRQRWTVNDLDMWLNGRRMTPKNSDSGLRASRLFEFLGKGYWQIPQLTNAFAQNVSEAAKVIETDALSKWLRRALNAQDKATEVENVVKDLKKSGRALHFEDQLVARTCMALDHTLPIRYKGISTMPAGLPTLLIDTAVSGNHASVLAEIISSQLVRLWIEIQPDKKPEYMTLMQQFERVKAFVEKPSFGSGIERVIYELNPSVPCLSPMLRPHYVASSKTLLAALEKVAASGNRPREPIDRHIAAFLIVRDKRGESLIEALGAPEGSMRRGLALLNLFSELQYRHGPESLPHLTAWLSPFVEPAMKRFLSKSLRERLQKGIKDAIAVGNLSAFLKLIDDPKRIERDRQDFAAARFLYLNIQKEIAGLEVKLSNRESIVRGSGKPMAASISSFLAIILICAAVLRALFEMWFQ